MLFFFVKLYEEYKRANTYNPEDRLTLYLSLILMLLFFSILIPIVRLLEHLFFFDINFVYPLFIFLVVILVLLKLNKFLYKIFFKTDRMKQLENKYKKYTVNRLVLYFIMILLPLILLFLGPVLGVIVAGGTIWDKHIQGIF